MSRLRSHFSNDFISKTKRFFIASAAALMLFNTVAAPMAVSADELDNNEIVEDQGMQKDLTRGLITGFAGAVPMWGSIISGGVGALFDNLWPEEGEINEIAQGFAHMELRMDENTQTILRQLYNGKMDDFDKDMTNLKEMTRMYLSDIDSYMNNKDMNDIDKAIEIGCLFENRSSNLEDFTNIISTSCQYVAGTPVSHYDHESIFVKAYKSCCDKVKEKTALGGEAAAKASPYVNQVSSILDNAQRVESMVINSKIQLADKLSKMSPEELAALKSEYSSRPRELALISEAADPKHAQLPTWQNRSNDVKQQHDLLFDETNPKSVVSRYNQMVENYRFCYISKADYGTSPATITYIPLQKELVATDFWEQGLQRMVDIWWECKPDSGYVTPFINSEKIIKASGLNSNQVREIAQAVERNNNLYNPDHKDRKTIEALKDFGFDVDTAINKDSSKYGVADPSGCTMEQLVQSARPAFFINCDGDGSKVLWNAYDLVESRCNQFYFMNPNRPKTALEQPYRRLLFFQKGTMPEDPWAGFKSTSEQIDAITNDLQCGIVDALTIKGVEAPEQIEVQNPEDINNEENQNQENQPVENEAIVLTVDENNQISGENEGTAWFVDEDGTLNLNNGYKFAFNGDVSNMNIICAGEITEGHFTNVTLNLTENAVISNAAFDNSEIYYTAGAVINENVVLNNTNLIDATVTNPEEAVTVEAE